MQYEIKNNEKISENIEKVLEFNNKRVAINWFHFKAG